MLHRTKKSPTVSPKHFLENIVVILPAGGQGSRLKDHFSPSSSKSVLPLPTGETMIERTIRLYTSEGVQEFIILVSHNAQSIIDSVGDGSPLGAAVRYVHDPYPGAGRGLALSNALAKCAVSADRTLILHNPDDQIVNYDGSFPRDIISAHSAGLRRGHTATAVLADGIRSPFTRMFTAHGTVIGVEMYPLLKIPTHIGVTVLSPAAREHLDRLFNRSNSQGFEGILFDHLIRNRALYSFIIPSSSWIAVNDPKALAELIRRTSSGSS